MTDWRDDAQRQLAQARDLVGGNLVSADYLDRALAELDKADARIAELERQLAADDAMLLHLDRAAPETSAWLFDAGLDIDNFRAALKRAAIAKAESKP